jgi:hypothetical protein
MIRVTRRSILLLLALLASACSGYGNSGEPSPPPSGSLGTVTQGPADEAILGLCEIAGAGDRDAASATFQDRSHQTLHVIAAATEVVDRAAAAELLAAKQQVEADLAPDSLPNGFGGHVEGLLEATRAALGAIGLAAPACPA